MMNSIETTVVSMHPSGRVVLHRKDLDGSEQYYVIARDAVNLVFNPVCTEFFFGATIQVHAVRKDLGTFSNNEFEPAFDGSVVEYSFNDVPKNFIAAGGSAEPRQFIVAVVQSEYDEYVGVVSAARTDKHYAVGAKGVDFKMFTFAIGYPMVLEVFYKLVTRGSNLWMIEDLQAKRDYMGQMEKFHLKQPAETPKLPIQTVTYYDLRTLTKDEKDLIETRTSITRDLTLEEAETFIRDPIICSLAAQTFMKKESIAPLQLNTPVTVTFDDAGKPTVSVVVLNSIFKLLTNIKTQDSWRIGNELTMKNDTFLRGNPIALIYDSYGEFPDDKQYFLVKFLVASRSDLFVKWMCKTDEYKDSIFLIGPPEDELSSAVETIISGFPRFFHRKNLFDVWRGYEQQPVPKEIPNEKVPYYVEGKLLDDTQLAAMRMAAGVPGFSCITAPPGSGKTFMISGLVKSIEEDWQDRIAAGENQEDLRKPQFAIVSTTNVAVTNALESIHRHYPEMRVCRDYSVKAEEELITAGQESNEISLKYLIESHQLDDLIKDRKYFDLYNKKEELTEQIRQKSMGMSFIKGSQQLKNLKKVESQLAREFVNQIEPTVYGTTAELMCRGDGDKITHLIVDEASQMSQFHALALYCALPSVTHITLLGDSKQLGPHLVLPKNCDMYRYQKLGELTRLKELDVCSHQELQTVYRCHPMLLDIWLKPIYGDLISGATEEERNYVKKYNLLQSRKRGAPTLMINVPGASGTSGRNRMELDHVIKFLAYLKRQEVPDEDITILCHHRAQREAMINYLRGKGNIGSLGLQHSVYTVDSFQGKEAKIVLVLTTKTTKADDYESICRALTFVSDENRETVAISRASHAMYIFGDWQKLGRMPFWRQFGSVLRDYGAVVDKEFNPIYNPFWFTAKDPERRPMEDNEGPQIKRLRFEGDPDMPLVSHVNLSLKHAFDQHPSNRIRTEQKAKVEAETITANFREAFKSRGPVSVPSTLSLNPFITANLTEKKPEAMEVVMSLIPPPPVPPSSLPGADQLPPQPPQPTFTADDVIDFQPSADYTPMENTGTKVGTLIDIEPTLVDLSIPSPTEEPMDTQQTPTRLPITFVEPLPAHMSQVPHIQPSIYSPVSMPPIAPVLTSTSFSRTDPGISSASSFSTRPTLSVKITMLDDPHTDRATPLGTSSVVSRPKIAPAPPNPIVKAKVFVATAEQRRAIIGLQNENCGDDDEEIHFDDKLAAGDLQIDRKYHDKTKRRLYDRHNQTLSKAAMCKCHKVPCRCDFDTMIDNETTRTEGKDQNTEFGFYVEKQFAAVFDNDDCVPSSWIVDLDDTVQFDRVEVSNSNSNTDYSAVLDMALISPDQENALLGPLDQ